MKHWLSKRPELFWRRLAGFLLLLLWFRQGWGGVWLSQLGSPPFANPEADWLYWLLQALGIPQFFLGSWGSWVLDITLGLGLVLQCFFPLKAWVVRLNVLSWLLYFVSYYAAFTMHNHGLIGGFALQLALSIKPFSLGLSGLRYYVLWMHASALGWKLARGTAWSTQHAMDVLTHQQAEAMHDAGHWVHFFLETPWFWWIGWYMALIWQGLHVLGFFTRSLDVVFFAGLFVFHIGNLLLLDTTFSDVLVVALAYVPLAWMSRGKTHT